MAGPKLEREDLEEVMHAVLERAKFRARLVRNATVEASRRGVHAAKAASRAKLGGRSKTCCDARAMLAPIPHDHRLAKTVDVASAIALVYTALLTPYEVCFLTAAEADSVNGWFVINRIIDLIFWSDLILQFRIIPEREVGKSRAKGKYSFNRQTEKKASTSEVVRRELSKQLSAQLEKLEVTKSMKAKVTRMGASLGLDQLIALKYLQGRFTLDFLTCLVSFFDYVPFMIDSQDKTASVATRQFKLLRLLRLLRLTRLLRLFQESRFVRRMRTRIGVRYAVQAVVECISAYVLMAHWFGCLFFLQTVFADSMTTTWLYKFGYCVLASDASLSQNASWVIPVEAEGAPPVLCAPPPAMWLASAFWMLQLISGTAGGPVDEGVFTSSEQIVFFFLVICAALAWGYLLGRFCDVLSNLSPEKTLFKQRMDHLNRWIFLNGFDTETAINLRTYMFATRHLQVSRSNHGLMELFSPKLRGEISLEVYQGIHEKVAFFQNIERECLEQVLYRLQPLVLVPRERATTTCFYFIVNGYVINRGFIIGRETAWGADCVLAEPRLRRFAGRALTYTELHFLTREDILGVMQEYPLAYVVVRWAAIKAALIRYLLDSGIERDLEAAGVQRAASRLSLEPPPEAGGDAPSASAAANPAKPSKFAGIRAAIRLAPVAAPPSGPPPKAPILPSRQTFASWNRGLAANGSLHVAARDDTGKLASIDDKVDAIAHLVRSGLTDLGQQMASLHRELAALKQSQGASPEGAQPQAAAPGGGADGSGAQPPSASPTRHARQKRSQRRLLSSMSSSRIVQVDPAPSGAPQSAPPEFDQL